MKTLIALAFLFFAFNAFAENPAATEAGVTAGDLVAQKVNVTVDFSTQRHKPLGEHILGARRWALFNDQPRPLLISHWTSYTLRSDKVRRS